MFSWAFCGKGGRFHCSLGSVGDSFLLRSRLRLSLVVGEAKTVSASCEGATSSRPKQEAVRANNGWEQKNPCNARI